MKCSNCHCVIDAAKIFLHERFCVQNIKYCEICKEGIIIEEYDEHCLEHNMKKNEIKEPEPEEQKTERVLQRVMSSKIACEYCGFFLGYAELEEHEEMCGARSIECKICKKSVLYKNLENHLLAEHGLSLNVYKSLDSNLNENININNNYNINNKINQNTAPNKPKIEENKTELDFNKMTSDEQIAYALALSEQESQEKNKGKGNENLIKKSTSGINYDEIENNYEKQMYEEEMNNYNF